jgi:hypothetical protein
MQITDLGRYLDTVRTILESWILPDTDWYPSPWFRGHGEPGWKLDPGQYRLQPPGAGVGSDWYNERTLLTEFKFRAPLYLPAGAAPRNDWEWLFLMQHYGLPTRLLDWTESSLIALYFALRDNRGGSDAVVWMLNPWWLNKRSLGEYDIPQADDVRLNPWAPADQGGEVQGRLPVAIKPIQASRRITSQRGFFTVHGAERGALERLAENAKSKSELRRLKIPRSRIAEMKRDLSIAGITETTIFPELDGLSREIKAWFAPGG